MTDVLIDRYPLDVVGFEQPEVLSVLNEHKLNIPFLTSRLLHPKTILSMRKEFRDEATYNSFTEEQYVNEIMWRASEDVDLTEEAIGSNEDLTKIKTAVSYFFSLKDDEIKAFINDKAEVNSDYFCKVRQLYNNPDLISEKPIPSLNIRSKLGKLASKFTERKNTAYEYLKDAKDSLKQKNPQIAAAMAAIALSSSAIMAASEVSSEPTAEDQSSTSEIIDYPSFGNIEFGLNIGDDNDLILADKETDNISRSIAEDTSDNNSVKEFTADNTTLEHNIVTVDIIVDSIVSDSRSITISENSYLSLEIRNLVKNEAKKQGIELSNEHTASAMTQIVEKIQANNPSRDLNYVNPGEKFII